MSVRKWAFIRSRENRKPVQCTPGVLSWVVKVTICLYLMLRLRIC